jgi:DNA replication protein DnaC
VGKTHLGVAILNAFMVRHHTPCLYIDVSDLLIQLRDTYNVNKGNGCYNELDLLRKYSTAEALMLDDISVEKVTEWTRDKIFQIVNYRYCNDMITVVTSNDYPDVLAEKIGDRTVSRLNDLTEFVEINGEDRRGRPIV